MSGGSVQDPGTNAFVKKNFEFFGDNPPTALNTVNLSHIIGA
jgi:hypothetical protein